MTRSYDLLIQAEFSSIMKPQTLFPMWPGHLQEGRDLPHAGSPLYINKDAYHEHVNKQHGSSLKVRKLMSKNQVAAQVTGQPPTATIVGHRRMRDHYITEARLVQKSGANRYSCVAPYQTRL